METREQQNRRPYAPPTIKVQSLTQAVRGEEGSIMDYFAEPARP